MIPPILYEDRNVVVVNKPPGVLSEANESGNPTLSDQIALYRAQRSGRSQRPFLGIVHRLDRPTSGCLVYAKNPHALRNLQRQFKERTTEKRYWAVVDAVPESPTAQLTHQMVHNVRDNKSWAYETPREGSKEARLSYRLVATSERYALLEIDLETGRHHQIRAQLAAVGLHIKGDLKYGARRSNRGGGIHLHAQRLAFDHPRCGDRIEVVARPPKDTLWEYFWENAE